MKGKPYELNCTVISVKSLLARKKLWVGGVMTRKDNKECGRTQKETMNIETSKVRESWLCETNACCKLCVIGSMGKNSTGY